MKKLFMKRFVFFTVSIFLVGFLFLFLHKRFQTKTVALAPRSVDQVFVERVNVEQLPDYLNNQKDDLVLLIKDESQDSDYLIESILTPLANEQEEQPLPEITKIIINEDSDISVTRLKKLLDIDRYPAFVYLNLDEDENYQIENTKEYDPQEPFSSDDLKTWFFNNDLWEGPYGVQ